MLSHPTTQQALRGSWPERPTPRAINTTEHQARLAGRLTARDKWIVRMLHEHRVLTSEQITALAFPSYRSGRQRLRELFTWSVVDRFALRLAGGGATPLHYVLGPAGASVLAAEHGLDVRDLGYRRERVTGIAHHQRLAHTVGVNEWFVALINHAQRTPGTAVLAWWAEHRCARHFGDLAQPDAYGRWHHTPVDGHPGQPGTELEFFLEFDLGTERPATRLGTKLAGYGELAAATGITTPVLFWLPTARREAHARKALREFWRGLEDPTTVPVATAAADLLDPDAAQHSPADPVWLPLGPAAAGATSGRLSLAELAARWPAPPAPTPQPGTPGPRVPSRGWGVLPPPDPMPPPRPARPHPAGA